MLATEPNSTIVSGLAEKIRQTVQPFLPSGPYALVDFPDHPNVGDSAIWLGELAYFSKHLGRKPQYTCSVRTYSADDLKRACPEGPIFIHGGGNFGDIWEHHQAFREQLLQSFRGRPIIQLPQSIHFFDQNRLAAMAKLIAAHGNFTLFVRDKVSRELAATSFDCETLMAPDMAFCLGFLKRPTPATLDILYLLRSDSEKSTYGTPAPAARRAVADWLDEDLLPLRAAKAMGLVKGALTGFSAQSARFARYEASAEMRVQRGLRLLSSGRTVVTDRLHSHILSALLQIPHAVLDNNYGKLTRFIDAWTADLSTVHRSTSIAEATSWVEQQLVSG